MDKNGQHGCFTPSILSIVICTFVRYKIPLQKAHVICKIINVQNDAKLAHINVRAIKSTVGYSERSSILTASEKHPRYKVFDYSVKIYFARYHTPLKNFMDNPPTHNKKEKQPHALRLNVVHVWLCFLFRSEKKVEPSKPGARPPSTYLIPAEPVRGGVKSNTSSTTNSHIIVAFGLQVMFLYHDFYLHCISTMLLQIPLMFAIFEVCKFE